MEFVYHFKQALYVQAWMNLECGLQFFKQYHSMCVSMKIIQI